MTRKETRTLKFVDGAAKFMATAKKIYDRDNVQNCRGFTMISTAFTAETVCEYCCWKLFGVCAAVTGIKTGVCQSRNENKRYGRWYANCKKILRFCHVQTNILWGGYEHMDKPLSGLPGRNYGSDNHR